MTDTKYRDLLPVVVERENATLPEGFDTWGLKSVHPDLKTKYHYQWPFPGGIAVADDVQEHNKDACPIGRGDGLCVAQSWAGMASGGIPARTLLLVATKSSDVLGAERGKSRHREVAVVAVVDGQRLLREAGGGADLTRADLTRADLTRANLTRANLTEANLTRANLTEANLTRADLTRANLTEANLTWANLAWANLTRANLTRANLTWANLGNHNPVDLEARGAIL